MSAAQPLFGNALIDCARANATSNVEVAADQCGFGNHVQDFRQALRQACKEIGVDEITFENLSSKSRVVSQSQGVEIAPDTINRL